MRVCLFSAVRALALEGSLSAASKTIFVSKHSFCSIFQDRFLPCKIGAATAEDGPHFEKKFPSSNLLALLAFSGGVLTSYAKARTAIEIPISNEAWPDLFERLERIIFLCAVLIAAGILPVAGIGARPVLAVGLGLYAALSHLTAVQRIARAVRLLQAADMRSAENNPGGGS